MYLIVRVVIGFVILMAVVFMVKAYREGVRMGMDRKKMRKAITASATFTAVPSISILLGVLALAGKLGVPISWMRLSVVGAIQYESVAAEMAAERLGSPFTLESMNGSLFVGITTVMTVGIIWGGLFAIFGLKKYQKKVLNKVGSKDNRWSTIMFNALFIGMVCAFVGQAFAALRGWSSQPATLLNLLVLVIAAGVMALCTFIIKKFGQKWLENFSLTFSMLAGMGSAIGLRLLGVQ
jgi:hypothetical protein